jgi:hypothetical protein
LVLLKISRNPTTDERGPELAKRRNNRQLLVADEQDSKVLHKYLNDDVFAFLPGPVARPDDSHEPPASFLQKLQAIAVAPVLTPTAPPFHFNTSEEALRHNSAILQELGSSMDTFLAKHQGSTLGYASEFRPVKQLRSFLGTHPHFEVLTVILNEGMDYRFHTHLSEAERVTELTAMIDRGNHKSAEQEPEVVDKRLLIVVTHGFSTAPGNRPTHTRCPFPTTGTGTTMDPQCKR